ncbi:MAG: GntR family transcriptional regulator [Burkholderiaceae bacterium]
MPKHARLRQAILDAVEACELPVDTKLAGKRELSEQLGLSLGTTQKALGRLMDAGFFERRQGHGSFVGSSRIYLPASRFARLLRMAAKRLADTNLQAVLATEFSAPTLHSEGLARMVPLDVTDALLMGVPAGTMGLQVDITGHSFGRQAISFHQMHIPPTPYALKFDFNPPSAGSATL